MPDSAHPLDAQVSLAILRCFTREFSRLSAMCRDRLETLRSELSQREEQAKQQSEGRLQSLAAEADRLEASARQEGEARCAAVQVWSHCLHACLRCTFASL